MLAVHQVLASQSSASESLNMKAIPYHDILVQRFRDDPQEAAAYLQATLHEFQQHGQVALLVTALQRLREARDIPLDMLPQPLSAQSIASLADFQKMVAALGYTLSITPKDVANDTNIQAPQEDIIAEALVV